MTSDEIRAILKRHCMSQREMAEAIGITTRSFERMLVRGRATPMMSNLIKRIDKERPLPVG